MSDTPMTREHDEEATVTNEELRPVRPGPHIKVMPWSDQHTDSYVGTTRAPLWMRLWRRIRHD